MSLSRLDRSTRRWVIGLGVALAILATVLVNQLGSGNGGAMVSSAATRPSIQATIAGLEQRLTTNPQDALGYAALGRARLQAVRETNDAAQYPLAEQALNQALSLEPRLTDALIGQGVLALARHDFRQALAWADKAAVVNPYNAEVWNVRTDAYVELGDYEQAVAAAQEAVNRRPDQASYSRVAYLRELHGDIAGAMAAMQRAVDAGARGEEGTVWAQVQLGNLLGNAGQWEQAEEVYRAALRDRPNYWAAEAGLARVAAAHGDYRTAIDRLRPLTERLPLPELVILLGDLYTALGETGEATRSYDLVRVIQQLNQAAGMNVDLELALFETDHGDDPAAALAQARAAYAQRPGIYGADTLAWALYHAGQLEEAWLLSQASLRLETRDARLYYHTGVIAAARQDTAEACRQLQTALAINPAFGVLEPLRAQALVGELACGSTPP